MKVMLNKAYTIQKPQKDIIRVVASLPDKNIVVISLIRKDSLPYELNLSDLESAILAGEAQETNDYPPAYIANVTEKQINAAQKSWDIIGNFVQDTPDCYDKKIRSRFIKVKSEETGMTRMTIQRLLYRFWAGGSTMHALYPEYQLRGGAGVPRTSDHILGRPRIHASENERLQIGEKELAFIEEAIRKHYTKHTKYTLHNAYVEMIRMHYTDDHGNKLPAYPTEAQFNYHAQQFIDIKKRVGTRIYNKDMRGITGSSRSEAMGPGSAYQIDATVADIYLVSHYNPKQVVGRPELYFVLDVFSHMIVGFYCCLESASWENAKLALLNAFSNKVAFCHEYGIEISENDWPCEGLPQSLIVDNGELISKASNAIIENLGITVKNEPSWRPDLKGIVESRFRLLNIREKSRLPGAVLPDFSQRGGHDYRMDAKLNLTQFTQVVIHFVFEHNKRVMREHPQPLPDVMKDGVPGIPIELWKWGIVNRTGLLRQMSYDAMNVALSERGKARVTSRGINFKGLLYECQSATEQNWFAIARNKKSWLIDIAYQPRNLSQIVLLSGGKQFEICKRTKDSALSYMDLSLEEYEWQQGQNREQKAQYAETMLQSEIDHNAKIEEIIQQAEQDSKVMSFERKRREMTTKKIKENRKKEVERMRQDKETKSTLNDAPIESAIPKTPEPTTAYDYGSVFAGFAEEEDDD